MVFAHHLPVRPLSGLQVHGTTDKRRRAIAGRSAWLLRAVALTTLSILAFAVKSLAFSFMRVASDPKQQVEDETAAMLLVDWIRNTRGPVGYFFFFVMQVSAIVACVPCSSTFDYTAGAAFGFWPGVGMVMLSKGAAAVISFFLMRSLKKGPIGRWAQQRARGGGGEGALVSTTARLHEGVKQGGLRFCILLRLSPMPSWIANYMLSLTGVAFPLYAASMIGMTPPLVANVYQGFAAAGIACSLSGKDGCTFGRRDGMGLVVLTSCQWLMGLVLAQQMAKFALEARRRSESESSTTAVQAESAGEA